MGKIKTVVMGDEIAEEKSRQSGKAKREQKRAEKAATIVKKETKKAEEVVEEVVETTSVESPEPESPAPEEQEVKKAKKKVVESKYRFPVGKKYAEAKSLVDPKKLYPAPEAIDLVKKTSYSQFDGSVEVHYNVTDQNLRGTVALPHGTGRLVKVKIADEALIADLEKGGKIDFDILVASPDMMPKLAKVAKVLGPKGLMPNPKTNTISDNPEGLALSLSKGQTQWKTQSDFPIIHAVIGRVSFEPKKLVENLAALTKSIGQDKIRSAFVKATMGPAIKLAIA